MAAQIGCTPAMIAAGETTPLYIGRRNVEGGGRQQDFHNSSFRGLIGTRGAISEGWDYDVSVQFSRGTATTETLNYFSNPRILRALDAVDLNGVPTCRSALPAADPRFSGTADPACVPYNVFQIGGVTNEALNYIQAAGLQNGMIDQSVILGVITGDLGAIGGKLPWADESIKVAFGVENRNDRIENTVDDLQTTRPAVGVGRRDAPDPGLHKRQRSVLRGERPPGAGQDGCAAVVRRHGVSLFGLQLRHPDGYVQVRRWTGRRLRTSVSARAISARSVLRTSSSCSRRRASICSIWTATRAAQSFAGTVDAASDAACLASGVPANQLRSSVLDSPAGQYNFLQGGDLSLEPETSDTYSYGIVFTPRFAPGLSVSADYFDIDVTDLISTYGAANTLTACYQFNDAASCGLIRRNPANGALWIGDGNVVDLNTNIGGLQTSGVDLNLNYTGLEMGSMGSLTFNLTGTYLLELIVDQGIPGFAKFDCAGLYAGACIAALTTVANPELRTRFRIGWQTPWNVDVALTHRYVSEVEHEDGTSRLASITSWMQSTTSTCSAAGT